MKRKKKLSSKKNKMRIKIISKPPGVGEEKTPRKVPLRRL